MPKDKISASIALWYKNLRAIIPYFYLKSINLSL